MTRGFAIISTSLSLITGAWGGLVSEPHQIQEIANAPLLAVCTVRDVTSRELVPNGLTRWNSMGRYFEAKLLVHRVFRAQAGASAPPRTNETITLRYISDDPNASCCVNGSPQWVRLKAGDVALFPLKPGKFTE